MSGRKALCRTGVVIFVMSIISFVLTKPITASAEEDKCFIVSMQGNLTAKETGRSITLNPLYLNVAKGSCVVFVNWIRGGDVAVEFDDAKTCQDVTESPIGFRVEQSCYVTSYLSTGATSSLRFMKAGEYAYKIKAEDGPAPVAAGKIKVE